MCDGRTPERARASAPYRLKRSRMPVLPGPQLATHKHEPASPSVPHCPSGTQPARSIDRKRLESCPPRMRCKSDPSPRGALAVSKEEMPRLRFDYDTSRKHPLISHTEGTEDILHEQPVGAP